MSRTVTILATLGSVASIGFGVWHFFVPRLWHWYSYIAPQATELIIAVRAINIFFSLTLTLLGIANLLFVYKTSPDRFTLMVMFSVSTILWGTRSVLQIAYPQGSQSPFLQYSMLSIFMAVFCCFALSLFLVLSQKNKP